MDFLTEVEVRHLVMAHCHSGLLHAIGVLERDCELSPIEDAFDALYGRPAAQW